MGSSANDAIIEWCRCIEINARADFAVNELLEDICRKYGKKYLSLHEDDDPIYHTLCNLTNAQRREFIRGAQAIAEKEGV